MPLTNSVYRLSGRKGSKYFLCDKIFASKKLCVFYGKFLLCCLFHVKYQSF